MYSIAERALLLENVLEGGEKISIDFVTILQFESDWVMSRFFEDAVDFN